MSRLILALAFLGYSTAAPPPPTACYGDAPGGERWIFLQPEHTGTDTTVRWLRALGSKTCAHGHELTPADAPPNVTFAFLLAANPFKRVLTSAAFHKIISGSRAVFPNRTRADDVAAFNAWVAGLRRPPVRAQTDVVAGFPVKFVGYTATLAADLAAVARALGYASPPPLGASHCITSCEPGDKINENGNGYHHGPDAGAAARRDAELGAWYSTAAAARAVGWFGADFDAFGFDPDVRTSPLGPIRRVSKLERL
mmetsp:Transcript_7513/g.22252  ORF Transcript_7513/g.22252 Transcript_7513/m.22252 type:complete len:254 (-) Transcript_7513:11-772(-)